MPPFAADAVQAGQRFALDHHPGAAAGADDDAEDDALAGAGAVGGFRDGETVGVVLHPHRAAQRLLKVLVERVAVQPCRVRVLDEAGDGRHGAGNADADGAFLLERFFRRQNQPGHVLDGRLVVVLRGGDALAVQLLAVVGVQADDFRLGAAEIDADAHALSSLINKNAG